MHNFSKNDIDHLKTAIQLAELSSGGPFGAVVVLDDQVIGSGQNQVVATHDPTAHAEIIAIRQACKRLETHNLSGCTLYASCLPCPMCMAACYWARLRQVFYAADMAADIGFDDAYIAKDMQRPPEKRSIPTTQGPLPLVLAGRVVIAQWRGSLY